MTNLWNGVYRQPAVWDDTAAALIAWADLQPGMYILDLGSADGGTLFPALDRVGQSGSVVGIEVEKDWVTWLQKEIAKREIPNAKNLLMDGTSMTFPNDSFDAVIMGMVGLDEDYDPDRETVIHEAPLMREVHRVLKPGCTVHCSGWFSQEDTEWMGDLIRRHLPGCAKRGYFPMTEAGYVHLLEFAGFERIRATTFERRYTFENPAEWMACTEYVWEKEITRIKADPDVLLAFEHDAFELLAEHRDENGKIAYMRPAILISAQKPRP